MTGDKPPPAEASRPDRRLGLAELTRAAGVSVRTVRYYIAEGLLPPPAGGGPASHYTVAHLDRLRLIARLKAAYLPLREIRRRLAGLDEAEVRRLLTSAPPDPGADARADAPVDDAASYLDRVLGARPAPSPSLPTPPSFPDVAMTQARAEVDPTAWKTSPAGAPTPEEEGSEPRMPGPTIAPSLPAPVLGRASPVPVPISPDADPAADRPDAIGGAPAPDAWRRISLGDDAELLIRETAYRRRRDRVDWLIAWARKVFD